MSIVLLSHFGTLLCLNAAMGHLTHQPLEDAEPGHVPLTLEHRGGVYAVTAPPGADTGLLSRLVLCNGVRPMLVALHEGSRFLRTDPDGAVRFDAAALGEWESFLPVAAADIQHLRRIERNWWRLGGGESVPAGVVRFNLIFGTQTFDLAEQLPFGGAITENTLILRSPQGDVVATRAQPPSRNPAVWINPLGNIGNRALQYLTAAGIAARVPGAEIRNVRLDMWGIDAPSPRPAPWSSASTGPRFALDTVGLADCLCRGEVENLIIDSYTFHVDHYPSRAECRRLLPPVPDAGDVTMFGSHELVCSIRGNEVLRAVHPDYFTLPPGYYKLLQEQSGLDLVFFGQLGTDAYTDSLRSAFPDARFIHGKSQAHDFEALRRAPNIALGISTFAWLAAWLGEAARIYLPVGGMFSPVQHPDQMYIVSNDPAYRYVLLPPAESVDLFSHPARFFCMQDYLAAKARFASAEEIEALRRRAEDFGKGRVLVSGFDTSFYLRQCPDAATETRSLVRTALGHFLAVGATHGRYHRPFDPLFYGETCPDASAAVTVGDYPNLFAHFMQVGLAQGYQPVP
jgi:hypothetical protein